MTCAAKLKKPEVDTVPPGVQTLTEKVLGALRKPVLGVLVSPRAFIEAKYKWSNLGWLLKASELGERDPPEDDYSNKNVLAEAHRFGHLMTIMAGPLGEDLCFLHSLKK